MRPSVLQRAEEGGEEAGEEVEEEEDKDLSLDWSTNSKSPVETSVLR